MNDIMNKLGQFFVLGFKGVTPPPTFLDFVSGERIGGVILFADNCDTHQTTREVIEKISQSMKNTSPFIAIDQEGGRICRIKGAPAEFSSAEVFGKYDNPDRFREQYSRAALFMESLGINLNLAPVADIRINPDNSCLDGRCFSDDPEKVANFVKVAVQVSSQCGLLSCLKHFPGLGAADIDPHTDRATIDIDLPTWESRERKPFEAGLEAGADMIMSTHVRLPQFDDQIATYSEKIITSLIREGLAFDGPVITDDLLMHGAEDYSQIGERAVAAFQAGHDLLLFGQDYELAMQAYDYFCEACNRGEISETHLRSAHSRVSGLKFKLRKSITS